MEIKTYYSLDKFGNSIPNATVEIYGRGQTALWPDVYDVDGNKITNPFTSDSTGRITFQVADGLYEIVISNDRTRGYRIPFQALDMLDPTGKINTAVTEAEAAAVQAELMRDQTQQIIDDAGEQSTLVALGQPSGYTKLNDCASIAELRAVKFTYHGQKVKLRLWQSVAAFIDVMFVYDANDTTSPDDGYRTIVNSDGQRAKAILSGGIDLRLAGLNADGSNLGTVFNRVYQGELARVIARGQALKMATIKIPELVSFDAPEMGTYSAKLDQAIKIPSFVPIVVEGEIYCEFTLTDVAAIQITNQITGITPSLLPWRDMSGAKMFKNDSGKFFLVGPGATVSQAAGLKVGNTTNGPSILDCRDTIISDLHIRQFRSGLDFDLYDTYILRFERLHLTGNYWNISALISGKANAGENMVVANSTIADAVSHQVNWNSPGCALTFEKSSLDYCGGSTFYLDNGARECEFKVEGGHIEGFGSFLVHQVSQLVAWQNRPNRVVIDKNCTIKAAGGMPGQWASRRQILKSGEVLPGLGTIVEINCPLYWPAAPAEPHIALMGYTDVTPIYMTATYSCPSSQYPDCLVSYRQSANKGLYRFSGTEGASVKGLADSATGYTFSTNGNPTIVYGSIDADGFQHVIINLDATTTWVEISNKGLYYDLERLAEINTGISVMMENITSGTLLTNTRFRYFYGTARTADGYEDGETYNVSALLTATYEGIATPLTTAKYVGVQTAMRYTRQDSGHPTQAEVVQPGIVLRGAVGQIRVKLPVIWPSRGKGACSVIS